MSRYFRYTLEDMKKSSDRKLFTYATTFAGGGGSSCGYKLSGGDCKFMNEFQEVACDTYIQNFPGTSYLCKDALLNLSSSFAAVVIVLQILS